jgi:hypothetical protein
MFAPIALFVYNRPHHTQQVINALKKNPESKDSELFIFCDGAKESATQTEIDQITKTKEYIKQIKGFRKITIIESLKNKGLAASIIEGVTNIVNKYGRIIVLEDDIVTSPGFLKYMNDALEIYSSSKKVMQVSAYVFPYHDNFEKLDTFFHKPGSCWGWGTWKNAWNLFEKNPEKQFRLITEKKIWDEFTLFGAYPSYKSQIEQNISGQINTWAIFWYASILLNRGTSLVPTISLVQNIGLDGSGENSGQWTQNNPFQWKKLADYIPVKKKFFYDSKVENILLRNSFRKKILGNLKNEKNYNLRDKFYLFRRKFFQLMIFLNIFHFIF